MMNKELKARFDEIEKQFNALKNEMKELEEKEEFKYPIYAYGLGYDIIVKFESLNSGRAINRGSDYYKRGELFTRFNQHSDTDVWQILPICEKTGFYHGQPVWARDRGDITCSCLCFFDAINSCLFFNSGKKNGTHFDFYEPWEGEWLPWMVEAFKKLKL